MTPLGLQINSYFKMIFFTFSVALIKVDCSPQSMRIEVTPPTDATKVYLEHLKLYPGNFIPINREKATALLDRTVASAKSRRHRFNEELFRVNCIEK